MPKSILKGRDLKGHSIVWSPVNRAYFILFQNYHVVRVISGWKEDAERELAAILDYMDGK